VDFLLLPGTMVAASKAWSNWGSSFIIWIWNDSWYWRKNSLTLLQFFCPSFLQIFLCFCSRFLLYLILMVFSSSSNWVWCRRDWW